MVRRRGGSFKINTGKWGKPTSVRIGKKGKGGANLSKRGVRVNPGCCVALVAGLGSVASAVVLLAWIAN
jgi:hypothetical protein